MMQKWPEICLREYKFFCETLEPTAYVSEDVLHGESDGCGLVFG